MAAHRFASGQTPPGLGQYNSRLSCSSAGRCFRPVLAQCQGSIRVMRFLLFFAALLAGCTTSDAPSDACASGPPEGPPSVHAPPSQPLDLTEAFELGNLIGLLILLAIRIAP